MLDDAGLTKTKIVASNDMDEHLVTEIKSHGGVVDLWGIGTKLATCYDNPALGGVFKLVSMDNEPRIKVSSEVEKTTIPFKKQVYRIYDKNNIMTGDVMELVEKQSLEEDVVYDPLNPLRYYKVSNTKIIESLLVLKVKSGKIKYKLGDWRKARETMEQDINHLSDDSKRLLNPKSYKVSISKSLHELRIKLIQSHMNKKK